MKVKKNAPGRGNTVFDVVISSGKCGYFLSMHPGSPDFLFF